MGYYVAVNLSFSASNSEKGLKSLANAARKTLEETAGDDARYTRTMCEQVAEDPNRYVHGGNKGDMFVWSGVWNYYSYEVEEGALKTFLLNCWQPDLENPGNLDDAIMFDFDRALLLVNPEQSEKTYMYEFRLKENGEDKYLPEVLVTTQQTELNWNPY